MNRRRGTALAAVSAALAATVALYLHGASRAYDPLAGAAAAKARGRLYNVLAHIPPQCYTKTDGVSNPCWVCHTSKNNRNLTDDWALQDEYQFNPMGRSNHWTNLFRDRRAAIASISDRQVLRYIREDNYTPLLQAMRHIHNPDLRWRPDLDFHAGFDAQGFARDGSGWRAFRYKPFPGKFWPTNGSTDEVFIRLPKAFRRTADGQPSREIYKANLAIVAAAVGTPDTRPDNGLHYKIEPISETAVGIDLNHDGHIGGIAHFINRLPAHYAGAADKVVVARYEYPVGTEFLHPVRYIDPDAPDLRSKRMKELRYSRKLFNLDDAQLKYHVDNDARQQTVGGWPDFGGDAFSGLFNDYGWRLTGYIEDAQGRLRLQTREEQTYCMGCHSGIGVTVDGSFSLPRKVPGAAGWGRETLTGIHDVPQSGSDVPEILRYLERVGGGDAFRANTELLKRFFPAGKLDRAAVLRAAPGGTEDIRALIDPSPARALLLDKAYMTLVHQQDFNHGRDALPVPARNVYRQVKVRNTGLKTNSRVYKDGRLWLDWDWKPAADSH